MFVLSRFICVVTAMEGVGRSDRCVLTSAFRFLVAEWGEEPRPCVGPGAGPPAPYSARAPPLPPPRHDHGKDEPAPLWLQPLSLRWASSE